MDKVYIVWKRDSFEQTNYVLSVHKTEEGANKEVEELRQKYKIRLEEKHGIKRNIEAWDMPYYYEEETLRD